MYTTKHNCNSAKSLKLFEIAFPTKYSYRSAVYLGKNISTLSAGESAIKHILHGTELPSKIQINHDKRGAPFIKICATQKKEYIMLSLTDEHDYAAGAAMWINPDSLVCGLGIDLASIDDFVDSPKNQIFFKKFFTNEELRYISSYPLEEASYRRACIFSAKEASFKSIAAKIRMIDPLGIMNLRARFTDFTIHYSNSKIEAKPIGETLDTVKLLEIDCIEITQKAIEDMAFSAALSFRNRKDSI